MLCPTCLHWGAADSEYLFDSELHCNICAQRVPYARDDWEQLYDQLPPERYEIVEQELSRIITSRSGLAPELREEIIRAIWDFRAARVEGRYLERGVGWFRFACTYFAPNMV